LRQIAITGIFLVKHSYYNDVVDFNALLPTHAVRFLACWMHSWTFPVNIS